MVVNYRYFFSKLKCNKGWKNSGDCCCNCRNKIELFKHPWNEINKGPCTEPTGFFACIVEHDMNKNNKGTLFEFKHGFCELYLNLKLNA